MRHDRRNREPRPQTRKVQRPPYEQLMADRQTMSFVKVGHKYGVSDNAVRKWIRWYEYQAELEASRLPDEKAPAENRRLDEAA